MLINRGGFYSVDKSFMDQENNTFCSIGQSKHAILVGLSQFFWASVPKVHPVYNCYVDRGAAQFISLIHFKLICKLSRCNVAYTASHEDKAEKEIYG